MIEEKPDNEEMAFMDKCFIAVLPYVLSQKEWKYGDNKPISSIPDRMHLASIIANECLKARRGKSKFADGDEK